MGIDRAEGAGLRVQRSRIVILALVGLGVAGALALRERRASGPTSEAVAVATGAHLVELGSTSCTSCKAMHEELSQLRTECGTSIAVEEIDVWKDEAAAGRYGVNVIPTQVFLDREGREIDRHVGFLARNEIRQRFAQRGLKCRQ
jgi:thioredoxin 1